MKSLKSFLLLALTLFSLTTCNESEVEPQFEEIFRFVDINSSSNISTLVNFLSRSPNGRTSSEINFNTEIGELKLDEIIERIKESTQPGPNYSIGLIPPSNVTGTIEWLILTAKTDGYIGYILQFEPIGEIDLDNYSGIIRTLDMERSIESEQEFENGQEIETDDNGRTSTVYTNCRCEYVFAPVYGPITGEIIGHDVIIECECDGGGGGGGGSTGGGIGDPISFPIGDDPVGGGGSSGGSASGGDGSSEPGGIDAGGGTGETVGIVPKKVPACDDGEIWDGETCVNEYELRKQLVVDLLELNQFALIENCDQIEEWIEIAQHTPPQSVIDKIENLDRNYFSIIAGDWDIQYIQNAEGPVVNLDYFPVTITQLPKNPANGQRFTPQGFFNYVRTNLNTFFENNSTEFYPYNDTENTKWLSFDYLGAIMRFEITPAPGLSQDGSVICSDQQANSWTFTTIESPIDWNHPVSGNRQFGLDQNSDGSYSFFTRGVDRVAEIEDELIGNLPITQSAFEGADELWNAFQDNLENFVISNAGQAQKQIPKIDRPDWEKVRDVLEGTRPVSDLGCN